MVRKERLLYLGSWQPGEMVNQCPKDHLPSTGEPGGFLREGCGKWCGLPAREVGAQAVSPVSV